MMEMRAFLRYGCFVLTLALVPATVWAQGSGNDAISAGVITGTVNAAVKEKLQTLEAMHGRLRDRLRKVAQEIIETEIGAFNKKIVREANISPLFPWMTRVQELYVSSNATAEEVDKELNMYNLQNVLGYAVVEGSRTVPSPQPGGTIDTGT